MAAETINLTIDEVNTLKFGIDIQGLDTTMVEARVIMESHGMNLGFPGTFSKGEVTVNIPILSRILKPDTYNAKLELIIEGERIFRPIEIEIILSQPVKVVAALGQTCESMKVTSPPVITASVLSPHTKTVDILIKENIDSLISAKNIPELLEVYSAKVLLKERYEKLDIVEITSIINDACQTHFGKNFLQIKQDT